MILTPYDRNQERPNYVTPGAVALGLGGLTGLGIGVHYANKFMDGRYENSARARAGYNYRTIKNNFPKMDDETLSKFRNYSVNSAPLRSMNPTGGFRKAGRGLREDFRNYGPWRTREINDFDRIIHKHMPLWKRDLPEGGRIFKTSFQNLMALNSVNQEFQTGSNAAIGKGLFKEVASQVGTRLGQGLGSSLGHMLGGKAGSYVGMGAGFIGGGILGYSALSMVQGLAKMGRRWTLPETGGNFQDSVEAQTMRQRALNVIRTSQFNMRSELGNEATRLYMGYA